MAAYYRVEGTANYFGGIHSLWTEQFNTLMHTADIPSHGLEGEFDIATARALFQVLSADQCAKAARNIGAGLARGGTLFVIGHMTDDTRLSPTTAVEINLMFPSMFDDGQAYIESEYRNWPTTAGFIDISREPNVMGLSPITARKT